MTAFFQLYKNVNEVLQDWVCLNHEGVPHKKKKKLGEIDGSF